MQGERLQSVGAGSDGAAVTNFAPVNLNVPSRAQDQP